MKEWSQYFHNAVPEDLLSTLLYSTSVDELNSLQSVMTQGRRIPRGKLEDLSDSLATYGNPDAVIKALQYLKLAKSVEPLATAATYQPWVYPPRPKPVINVDTQALTAEVNQRIPSSDPFIAARYRFQIMRMLYYSGNYAAAQEYYEKSASTFKDETSVRYRFMELAGGAYAKEKKFGKANYLFSLVFDKFPQMKASAYLSFHPMEDADWRETLQLARNNHEKEVLWQLLGIYSDGMSAIENIYAMNPQSKLLQLLLVREVNLVEERWTTNQVRLRQPGGTAEPDNVVVGLKRVDRIRNIANDGKVYRPYLWLLATGHLLALAGNTAEADMYLQRARRVSPDYPVVRDQLRASALLVRVRSAKAIDKNAEPLFARELEWLHLYTEDKSHSEARNLQTWALERLAGIYKDGGQRGRSLMLGNPWSSELYQNPAVVDEILATMQNAKTDFDRFLLVNFNRKLAEVQEIRGMHYIYAGDFAKALSILRLAASDMQLDADPFVIHIRDCRSCDATPPHQTYTRVSFAERMQTLSGIAQGKDQAAANASFEMANGFYNMSDYGNNRNAEHFSAMGRSLYDAKSDAFPIFNMDMAETYYVQAANLSADREFKARALFMAAKAEQNRTYNLGGPAKSSNPHRYFAQLKDSFSDSQYFQEILRECGYFKHYIEN